MADTVRCGSRARSLEAAERASWLRDEQNDLITELERLAERLTPEDRMKVARTS